DDNEEVKLYTRSDVNAKKAGEAGAAAEDELSAAICRGLGGKKNISDVDCCATRLRCTVHKPELVDDAALKATGASGVVHKGNGVQIIYGPRVTVVKSNLEDYLETAPNEEYIPQQTAAVEEKAAAEVEGKVVDTIIISSPVNGTAADLSETPDDAFAGRMMGDGAMVVPEEGVIYAPEDGEICFIFGTKHAIGFQTESGVTMLLHVGIDTVKLDGKGFEPLVKEGDKVKKGDPMMKVDLDYLKANAPSLATPVLCTELEENQKIRLLANGAVKAGQPLFAIDIYER
ncbi:MAG: PTS glucose transporter subunit IIA, partial [Lachnospiraceae bacterium]|nr:PTS glucose transporter subunit IIA [Lachnospiraceae bacterium]